ncbi:hypothetical protein [Okibacterium endophyticum]
MRSLSALLERGWLLKVAGQLDEALDITNEAVRLARFTGNRRDLIRPRLLRSQVLQFRGAFDEAVHELTSCAEEARTHEWHLLEAFSLQHRGRVFFDQRDYAAALGDFTRAIDLRRKAGASDDQLEPTLIAAAVTESFLSASDQPAAG